MANTGYKGYSTLLKVTDDETNRPLDINNNLCSESGLSQDSKPNSDSDPNYIAPIYDDGFCPLVPDPGTLYSYRRDGSQEEGSPSFHIPYISYIDPSGNPATFYADMWSDACGSFYALSITDIQYCTEC